MSSLPAILFPIFYVLFQFLAWVGTCVSFGGVLQTANYADIKWNAYYDHIEGGGSSTSYDNLSGFSFGNDCDKGGKGFIAMQVFAFLSTFFTIILIVLRLTKFHQRIPALSEVSRLLAIEVSLTAISLFFYFLAVVIWGASCYTAMHKTDNVTNLAATGYAYVIICFFFLLFALVIAIMTAKAGGQLGSGGSSGDTEYARQTDDGRQDGGEQMNSQHGSAAEAHHSGSGGYGSYQDAPPPSNPNV